MADQIKHYWGLMAIAKRLGLGSTQSASKAIIDYGLPAYPRYNPHNHRRVIYASEAMILAWELTRAKEYHRLMQQRREAKKQRRVEAENSARKLRQPGGTHSTDEQG